MLFPITAKFGNEAEGTLHYASIVDLKQDGDRSTIVLHNNNSSSNRLINRELFYTTSSLFNAFARSKMNNELYIDLNDEACQELENEGILKRPPSKGRFERKIGGCPA